MFSKWYSNGEIEQAAKDLSAIFKFFENCDKNHKVCNKEDCSCKSNNNLKEFLKKNSNSSDSSYKGFEMKNICDDANRNIGVELTYFVPGIEKDNISASIDGQTVAVTSNKDVPYFGKLNHKVKMKFEIDKANSKLENGILKIFLYKKKEEEPLKIKIM